MAHEPTVKKRMTVREIETCLAWIVEAQKTMVARGKLHDAFVCLMRAADLLIEQPTDERK